MTTRALAKVGIGARIILYAVVAGLLAGGLAIPAVGAVGLVTRNQTNDFNTMKAGAIGQLPVRSEILDSKGRLLAYFYPRGIDREPVTLRPDLAHNAQGHRGHRGLPVLPARGHRRPRHDPGRRLRPRAQAGPGRVHAHPAVREERAHPDRAEPPDGQAGHLGDAEPQDQGTAAGHRRRGEDDEGTDPGGLPQRRVLRHLLRQPGGRGRSGRRALLRHHRGQADPAPGGHAGRDGGEPVPRQSRHQPVGGDQAAQRGAGPDGPAEDHHPGPGGGRRQAGTRPAPVPAADRLHQRLGQERRVLL